MWNDVQEAGPSESWAELAENGWGALMGWAAGDENLRRRPSSDEGRTVAVSIERQGLKHFFEEPFSAADRKDVDDDIDTFLRDAGIPPRPRGYVWMIRVPGTFASPEAFIDAVDGELLEASGGMVHPADLRPVFVSVLGAFYRAR